LLRVSKSSDTYGAHRCIAIARLFYGFSFPIPTRINEKAIAMLTAGIAGIAKKIFMELSQSFDFNLLANFLSNVTNSI
jgi:hypothetical protein